MSTVKRILSIIPVALLAKKPVQFYVQATSCISLSGLTTLGGRLCKSIVSMMSSRKILLKLYLLLVVKCEFDTCSPLNYNGNLKFAPPFVSVQIPRKPDTINDIFSPDSWFPIEINVPDTFLGAWASIESAWQFTSDYWSMEMI